MVGRTPELLGKKVEAREMKIATIVALAHPFVILIGTAVACYYWVYNPAFVEAEGGWLNNPGFHGLSEMLYEYTSASANNGSGFEGLGDNTYFWNFTTGLALIISRYLPIVGQVAIAGLLAQKKYVPESAGTLKTDTATFAVMTFSVIFIVAALSFFPALTLGPIAEARGKAQADSLRKTREETPARLVGSNGSITTVSSSQLKKGDVFICEAGDTIPSDGEIVEGLASIDESAITGESAPVIREAGGDKSSVTGGTKVLSDQIRVVVTTQPGESFLDKMIALVEGASRQKTPNEIALTILLADYSHTPITIAAFISLFVCLIPTTIGNRKATRFYPVGGIDPHSFVQACLLASLSDETPEGKSVVELGREQGIKPGIRERFERLRGVAYKPIGASALLRRNLLIYGVGGIIAPFAGIKLIDLVVSLFI